MASVSADVLRRSGEEEGNNAHMEQEMLVDPAQHGAGSVPAADSAANIPEGHNGPRGEQPEHSEEEILWIPIYNYLYQKFIYVSILKLRR